MKPGGLSAPCLSQGSCEDDLVCIDLTYCGPLVNEGGSHAFNNECKEGMLCYGGKCIRPNIAGDSCAPGDICDVDLVCYYPAGSSSAYCKSPLSAGLSCQVSAECEGRCDSKTNFCVPFCEGP
jgi:hypothetical protein